MSGVEPVARPRTRFLPDFWRSLTNSTIRAANSTEPAAADGKTFTGIFSKRVTNASSFHIELFGSDEYPFMSANFIICELFYFNFIFPQFCRIFFIQKVGPDAIRPGVVFCRYQILFHRPGTPAVITTNSTLHII